MPTYDYHCENCKTHHEISQKISEEPLKICPSCHQAALKRGPGGGIGLSFKGSGFYITDYVKKNSSSDTNTSSKGGCGCGKKSCDK